MLGALGGATVVALLLNTRGLKPAVLILWVMFAAVAWVHAHGVPA